MLWDEKVLESWNVVLRNFWQKYTVVDHTTNDYTKMTGVTFFKGC
jgi:hypothetical protein